jgi:GxxExxY protein
METDNRPRDNETYALIGAAIEVRKELGNGFDASVYCDAFEVELQQRGTPYQRAYSIPVSYKGVPLDSPFEVDFLCYENVLVIIKSMSAITPVEDAQVINFLKATGMKRGLLINFGAYRLEYKRLVHKHRPAWTPKTEETEEERY